MSVHKVIREGRKALGMSEYAFAKACGVSRTAVQHWEMEDGTAPKRARQEKVAEVLGLTVDELMSGRGKAGPYSLRAMRLAQLFDNTADQQRQMMAYAVLQTILSGQGAPSPTPEAPPLPAPTPTPTPDR